MKGVGAGGGKTPSRPARGYGGALEAPPSGSGAPEALQVVHYSAQKSWQEIAIVDMTQLTAQADGLCNGYRSTIIYYNIDIVILNIKLCCSDFTTPQYITACGQNDACNQS